MRISDWSSDVCSSDLHRRHLLDFSIRRPFSMTFSPNFSRLTLLHRQLDDAARREARRRGADPFRLLRLKTLKLEAKDRLPELRLRPAQLPAPARRSRKATPARGAARAPVRRSRLQKNT